MAAIRDTFFQECEEQLAYLESGLLALDDGDTDPETVNAVFRAVHSIKGGAGAFGLEELVRFAHVFETALDDVRAGRMALTPPVLKTMLRAADALADLVRAAQGGQTADAARIRVIADEVSALCDAPPAADTPAAAGPSGGSDASDDIEGLVFQPLQVEIPSFDLSFDLGTDLPAPEAEIAETPAEPAGQVWTVRFRPGPALYAKANETSVLLRELLQLGTASIELDASRLPSLMELDPEGAYLAWTIRLTTTQPDSAIREVFEFVDGDCELDVVAGDVPSVAAQMPEPAAESAPALPAPAAVSETDVLALIEQARKGGAARPAAPAPAAPVQAVPAQAVPAQAAPVQAAPVQAAPVPAAPVAVAPAAAPSAAAEPALRRAEPQPAQQQAPAKPTIRVDLERVDRLIDLVGELVINQAMLAQRVMESGLGRSSNMALGLDDLEHLTRDIQESVMAIRAQPVRSVFQRMPRLVREVAAMTGKPVRLVTEGEGTEVDKTVIEHLADPLTHMIRNAIDHGLESPAKRQAAGKPAEGTVRLAALHRSGRIVIEVSDDGAGIDRARVKAIAAQKGLIAADAVLTDEEADNLIFLPGFSTADKVSDISGRGVGMDVVKRSIQALGGRITIASRPGLGSTFTLSLPLTLAVLDGMVVTVEGQTLVVPLTGIIETLQPRAADVHSLGADARVIAIRGSYVPLVDVGHTLSYRSERASATAGVALLVEGEDGTRTTLLVDAIQGQRQVVIKSLEANYRHVPGIAAATILGDGRVALILDIDAVVSASRTEPKPDQRPEPRPEPQPAAGELCYA